MVNGARSDEVMVTCRYVDRDCGKVEVVYSQGDGILRNREQDKRGHNQITCGVVCLGTGSLLGHWIIEEMVRFSSVACSMLASHLIQGAKVERIDSPQKSDSIKGISDDRQR